VKAAKIGIRTLVGYSVWLYGLLIASMTRQHCRQRDSTSTSRHDHVALAAFLQA
jgi:hypothetical protein